MTPAPAPREAPGTGEAGDVARTDNALTPRDPEFRRLVVDWNATSASLGEPACLPDLIEEQARVRPEAVAVRDDDETLTYAQLDRRANQLAQWLTGQHVGTEDRVGIHLSRSSQMVVAVVGILKAGAAYLPLDEDLPAYRLDYLMDDAQARLVVTQQSLAQRCLTRKLIRLDADRERLDALPDTAPPRAITPRSLAYVIYTSGSTGRPKAVMLEHAGVVNLARWHAHEFGVTQSDRGTLTARLGFDASVWEMWPYFASGGSVHIAPQLGRLAAAEVRDWLLARQITLCWLPPAIAENVVDLPWPSDTPLRVLFVGSDRLSNRPPATFPARMVNVYGPTETTVISTFGDVTPRGEEAGPPHIGRPLANHRAYVLDAELRPLPVGVPGELYLGGIGLARGYLARPSLTATSFVPDPFSERPGDRLYRTGDVAMHRPDQTLAFIGRRDDQVKIRGYRVELAEVGLTLRDHPRVSQAEAVAVDLEGVRELVAFVVADQPVREAELREHCATRLPHYLTPSRIIALSALPLTANRKVDRDELNRLAVAMPVPARAGALPRTETERLVAGVWQEVLGLTEVDVETNFADLGGHSLLAMRVHALLSARHPKPVRLVDLFAYTTVRSLSRYLDSEGGDGKAAAQRGQDRRERLVRRKLPAERTSDGDG